ncbi:MAG: hypothetical protein AAF502_03130 [Bacteroidota bacterium]
MTDFGLLLLLLSAYLTYRFVIKPRFLEPPKEKTKIRQDNTQHKKNYDGGEFIEYEEVKE